MKERPRLLDQVRDKLRTKDYSIHTCKLTLTGFKRLHLLDSPASGYLLEVVVLDLNGHDVGGEVLNRH